MFLDFPVTQMVKNLPATQETRVQSLGGEDPLEKEMATHSSFVAWRMPRAEDPDRLQSVGSQQVGHDQATNTTTTPCCRRYSIKASVFVSSIDYELFQNSFILLYMSRGQPRAYSTKWISVNNTDP